MNRPNKLDLKIRSSRHRGGAPSGIDSLHRAVAVRAERA